MLSLEKETFRGYGISLKKKKKKWNRIHRSIFPPFDRRYENDEV